MRFGDPEAAILLARLGGDLLVLLADVARGELRPQSVQLGPEAVLGVVMAASGYPGAPRKGDPVVGTDEAAALPSVSVFHAGTRRVDGRLVTGGGRVLLVVARADDLDTAAQRAYRAVACVRFEGAQFRRDIGWRARH